MPHSARRAIFLGVAVAGLLAALRSPAASPLEIRLRDEKGEPVRLAAFAGRDKPCVLVFVASTCPVSALAWERLKGIWYNHRDSGVRMALVGGNSDDSPEALRAALNEDPAGLDLPILWDPKHDLAAALGVDSTPIAVVLSPSGAALYRGPLDDNWREGARATRHLLDDALRAALKGRASPLRDKPLFPGSRMR